MTNNQTIPSGFALLRQAALGGDIAPSVVRAVVAGMMANVGFTDNPSLQGIMDNLLEARQGYLRMSTRFPQHPGLTIGLASAAVNTLSLAERDEMPLAEFIETILQNREQFTDALPEHHPGVLQSLSEIGWFIAEARDKPVTNLAFMLLRIATWPDPVGSTIPAVIGDVLDPPAV